MRKSFRNFWVCSFLFFAAITLASPAFGGGTSCGDEDEACCPDNTCDTPFLVCAGGTCKPCGGTFDPCCDGNGCNAPGVICDPNDTCVPCGGTGEPCCAGGACDFSGIACDLDTNTCENCGLENEQCCENFQCSGPDVVCDPGLGETGGGASITLGGTCVACGDDEEPCCDNDFCNSGGECESGSCEICGSDGDPCCPINQCDPGSICVPDLPCETVDGAGDCETSGGGAGPGLSLCQPCGELTEFCCPGFVCNEGFVCAHTATDEVGVGGGAQNGIINLGECIDCGALGELCCADSTCDTDNLICGGIFCEACGAIGEQCCANDTCPGGAAVCVNGTCQDIEAAPAMGPGVIIGLLLALMGVAGVSFRRR